MTKYSTIQGDMWDLIAYKVYGNERYINLLLEANQEHRNTAVFSAGVVLACPDIPPDTLPEFLPPWRR
mgnify:FL=1